MITTDRVRLPVIREGLSSNPVHTSDFSTLSADQNFINVERKHRDETGLMYKNPLGKFGIYAVFFM